MADVGLEDSCLADPYDPVVWAILADREDELGNSNLAECYREPRRDGDGVVEKWMRLNRNRLERNIFHGIMGLVPYPDKIEVSKQLMHDIRQYLVKRDDCLGLDAAVYNSRVVFRGINVVVP